MTKVDLSSFYMHFLISEADDGKMQFMWEGMKYHSSACHSV